MLGRRVFRKDTLVVFVVMLTFLAGCTISGGSRSEPLQEASPHKFGWWVGPRGNDSAIDIGFHGKGVQIEIVRSYLSHTRIDSPVGKRWTHNYLMHIRNTSDRRIQLFDGKGQNTVFTKTESGTLSTGDEKDSRLIKSDGEGLHKFLDEAGTMFEFSRKGRLTHIQGNQYGNKISLAYGADGYLESISDAEGNIITFYYDQETHRIRTIRDGRGRSVSYEHDSVGNLVSVTNANGITSKYSYDRQSRLVGVTFP